MTIFNSFQSGRQLKELTTFGIGGPAKFYVEARTPAQMQEILCYCQQEKIPFFIIGKGSNVLFDDKGFNGVVIANRIDFIENLEPGQWQVGAGYSFSLLGTQTARQGYSGLEFASGIPGSVGGAVYMNAGANGHEMAESLVSVDFINLSGKIVRYTRSELSFGYRHSSFHQMQGAIISAVFKLTPFSEAREKQLKIIEYRTKTQPYSEKSAGCIFQNPKTGHAGALIEKAGLKGRMLGGAQVSTLHANFFINTGCATAKEVLELVKVVKKEVEEKTGIDLELELRSIPYELPITANC
ncbi:MAG: UDP-N-acetylmuramate dehydrogenase [Candidatus Protochlamydia sp.]|nr:UDP-N-acetylmuramate dehydrogenase [Candidatus Protochlamydia sp.]